MMRFDFASTGSPSVIAAFDAANLGLEAGFGVHKLTVWGNVKGREVKDNATFQFATVNLMLTGSADTWLAAGSPTVTRVFDGHEHGFIAEFPLTDHQLRLMEDLRAGRDLILKLAATAHLPGWPEAGTADSQANIVIPASSWSTLLERARLVTSSTVTITLVGADDAHREAGERLREARQALNNGDVDIAILNARRCMERVKDIANWPEITKADDLQKRSQQQRWRAIWKAAFDQASGAVHEDETTKTFSYTRAEAEALIGIAAALLKAAPAPLT